VGASATALELQILGQADFQIDQFAVMAGSPKCRWRCAIGAGKTLLQAPNREFMRMIEAAVLRWNFDALESLLGLIEILLRRKPAAGAVLCPLMLNQAAAGHV
jgi:hypothetical protein